MPVGIYYCVHIQSRITKKEKADIMILDLYYIVLDLSGIKLPFQIAINILKYSQFL